MSDALAFDVAILGGGAAGSLLARQLKRAVPELAIGVFERSTERSYKVGEATVEISASYLVRRHGLNRYLYEHHLPKNGLRYFFDTPERSAALEEMSEIGTVNLPFHPTFQIDRERLESDLLEWNRADGIAVHEGTTVRDVALGEGGARHRFVAHGPDGAAREVTCRWLVDATGRTGLVARDRSLRVPEDEHRLGAVWGRFRGVREADELGSEAFRARVRHTCRSLSTMHFWYPGYWMWFIPLRHGITSVGLVGKLPERERGLRDADGFQAFLNEHRAVSQLMEGAEAVDIASFTQIAYGTKRFFHPDGWALIGEAATAADPLYSPGLDFVALENDFVTDWIRREHGGEEVSARLELYERFMQFRHQAAMRLYRGLYDLTGSYEVMRLKWEFDIACYYHLWVSPYLRDQYLCTDFLRKQLLMAPYVLRALDNFAQLFRDVEAHVRATGAYHRANLGRFSYGLENIDFLTEVGLEQSEHDAKARTEAIFNVVRRRALELMDRPAPADEPPRPLSAFIADRPLA